MAQQEKVENIRRWHKYSMRWVRYQGEWVLGEFLGLLPTEQKESPKILARVWRSNKGQEYVPIKTDKIRDIN